MLTAVVSRSIETIHQAKRATRASAIFIRSDPIPSTLRVPGSVCQLLDVQIGVSRSFARPMELVAYVARSVPSSGRSIVNCNSGIPARKYSRSHSLVGAGDLILSIP